MKQITLDWETYQKELALYEDTGFRHGVYEALRIASKLFSGETVDSLVLEDNDLLSFARDIERSIEKQSR